jgi:hypothetical protein
MIEIFRPRPPEKSEWVISADRDQTEMLLSVGRRRIADQWKPLRFRSVIEDEGEILAPVDAPWMSSSALVLKPSARAFIEPLFGSSVEYVPIVGTVYDELYYVHVLQHTDVLDLDRSEIKRFPSSGRIMRIVQHQFLRGVEAAGPIFKLSQMPRESLYVSEAVVSAIAHSGLTGFAFRQVWSDQGTLPSR